VKPHRESNQFSTPRTLKFDVLDGQLGYWVYTIHHDHYQSRPGSGGNMSLGLKDRGQD